MRIGLGENFPYTNFHDLNLDWILEQIKQFKSDYGNIDEFIQDAIDKYLEEHPEYNIADESITSKKLKKQSIPFYNVTDYGVSAENPDNYRAIYELIKDKVSKTGGILYFPAGRYVTSYTIFIPENTILLGEGEDTEIYFDETDTAFGVCIANAGSNITIKNITIGQRSTGTFTPGSQPGCIGLTNIDVRQCDEPPYSHNFIRCEEIHDITVEDVYFNGFYAIQTENGANSVISNITYRNLITEGCVSIQIGAGATAKNIIVDNIECDLLRYQVEGTLTNLFTRNIICNSLAMLNYTNDYITLENIFGRNAHKQNTIGTSLGVHALIGNINIINAVFNGDSNYDTLFYVYEGIRKWDNVIIHCPTNQRALLRSGELSDTTNYEIMNNCIWECGTANPTTVFGYGYNNKLTGNTRVYIWGTTYRKKDVSLSTTGTYVNYLYWNKDRVELQIVAVPDTQNLPNVIPLPQYTNLPFDNTSGYINIVLFKVYDRTAQARTWGKIDKVNNEYKIIITDPAFASSVGEFDRILVKQELRLTREPTITEMYDTFLR